MADGMNGTADTRERQINTRPKVTVPKKTGVYTSPVGGIEERRGTSGTYTSRMTRPRDPVAEANKILAGLDGLGGLPSTPAGGTGVNSIALQAIQTLKNRLAGPSAYDTLGEQVAKAYSDAEARIRQAGSDLGARLSTPMATPTFNPAISAPTTAMSNYLSAIGASGADVSAQQALTNAALQQIAQNAQQYATGLGGVNQAYNQTIAAGIPANTLQGITEANLRRAAIEAQLAQAKANERSQVEDQILQYALKYGVKL